jgi:hypothetical protein
VWSPRILESIFSFLFSRIHECLKRFCLGVVRRFWVIYFEYFTWFNKLIENDTVGFCLAVFLLDLDMRWDEWMASKWIGFLIGCRNEGASRILKVIQMILLARSCTQFNLMINE